MSEPKLISPMLDGFVIGDPISERAGVRCCPAMKVDADDRYIVKIVSNPASQKRLEALLLTGAYPDAESAKEYFRSLADEVVSEIEVLTKLSQLEGFLPIEGHQVVPMEDGETGFDVYILSPYRRTLEKQFKSGPITHLGAINLGLDICSALSVCRQAGYLFVDLKPSNIHILNGKDYRIGDLGFVKLSSLKYASLPEKYHSAYTAPEVADAFSSLNTTIDVYALGLILYRAYNGGRLPFSEGVAPAQKFDPPAYADYEMAEIILKACDPDPAQRWEDPTQMGQALVSYMQRNGANDTPIAPPIILEDIIPSDTPDQNSEEDSEEQLTDVANESESGTVIKDAPKPDNIDMLIQEVKNDESGASQDSDDMLFTEDENGNLSFLLETEDETTQELDAEQIEYEEVTDEVSEMLSQADEIVSHPVPDPVVAPDPVDVAIPEPITPEATIVVDSQAEENTSGVPESSDENVAPDSVDALSADTAEDDAQVSESEQLEDVTDEGSEDESIEENISDDSEPAPKKHILRNILLILLAAAIIAAGILFYQFFYLQKIDVMSVTGDEDSLTVNIVTDVEESKLYVVCSDVYGTKTTKSIQNGKAEFSELLGGTEYTVTVHIDGFHKLYGDCKKTYYTPILTNIVQLSAVVGAENGSAIVSFTPDGPDAEQWQITYTADGEASKTVTFEGHTATIKGLTVGTQYKMTLSSANELYLSGAKSILFTAENVIYPENLIISSFKNSSMTVNWSAPEGAEDKQWSVRCYNATGYNATKSTDQTLVTFDDIDVNQDYTVEVSAVGQSVSQRTTVEENSIVISDVTSKINDNGQLSLNWKCDNQIPQGGWNVICTIKDTDIVKEYATEDNQLIIKDTVPGLTYEIEIKAENDSPVICPDISCYSGDGKIFYCKYGGAVLTGDNITLSMCITPEKTNWSRKDLKKSDYTTVFKNGQKASFVCRAWKLYGLSDDEMIVTYAIYSKDGKLLSIENENRTWNNIWDYYYGELNIPKLPAEAGEYKVVVYFNSGRIGEQTFTITT